MLLLEGGVALAVEAADWPEGPGALAGFGATVEQGGGSRLGPGLVTAVTVLWGPLSAGAGAPAGRAGGPGAALGGVLGALGATARGGAVLAGGALRGAVGWDRGVRVREDRVCARAGAGHPGGGSLGVGGALLGHPAEGGSWGRLGGNCVWGGAVAGLAPPLAAAL